MNKYTISIVVILTVISAYLFLSRDSTQPSLSSLSPSLSPTTTSAPKGYEIETIVTNVKVPWSIAFTSNQRFLITERTGTIWAVENNQKQQPALYKVSDVSRDGESGLLSITPDPDYQTNQYIYIAYTTRQGNRFTLQVDRLRDEQTRLVYDATIIRDLPANRNHAGSRIAFGPDNKLYVTVGDALERQLAQDNSSLAGKILRLNTDGSIPTDNPTKDSLIYAKGLRNPQGLAWDTQGNLYATDHGPSGFDGPGGGDEINQIIAGGNYGWPLVSHEQSQTGLLSPKVVMTPAIAPASIAYYEGDKLPEFFGKFLVGGLAGEGLYVVDPKTWQITKLMDIQLGRIREVTVSPDGYIYFTTSNTDGRGEERRDDDRILRIRPRA